MQVEKQQLMIIIIVRITNDVVSFEKPGPDIEDGYQFLLICQIIQKYIRPFYYRLIKQMQSNQINILRNLEKYVYQTFAIRKSLIG